jgi:hypothetical protein
VVNALLQGADLYMTRPINYRELLSRMRALLRRSNASNNDRPSQTSRTGKGRLFEFTNAYLIVLWSRISAYLFTLSQLRYFKAPLTGSSLSRVCTAQ